MRHLKGKHHAFIPHSAPGMGIKAQITGVAVLRFLVPGAIVIIATAAPILLFGANPLFAAKAVYSGSFGSAFATGQTIKVATILTLSGLASALPFTARLWNVGGEGQIYLGAIASLSTGLLLEDLPSNVVIPAMLVAGALGGMVWALIPGLMQALLGASEMIVSLLMNFLAVILARYIIHDVFPDSSGQTTEGIDSDTLLKPFGILPGFDFGVVLTIVLLVIIAIWMRYSPSGFAIRAVGAGVEAARLAGFSVLRTTLVTFALGGAAAGLGGALLVLSGTGELSLGISADYGFIGIAVALVAGLRIAWIPFAALFFAALTVGGNSLQAATGLPHSMSTVVVGILVLSLLATNLIGMRSVRG